MATTHIEIYKGTTGIPIPGLPEEHADRPDMQVSRAAVTTNSSTYTKLGATSTYGGGYVVVTSDATGSHGGVIVAFGDPAAAPLAAAAIGAVVKKGQQRRLRIPTGLDAYGLDLP